MTRRHRVFALALPLLLGGCSLLGQATNMVVGLVNTAFSLAMAAAPFALAYYFHKRRN